MQDIEIAACGLICSNCSIKKVTFDDKSAEEVYRWFLDMKWIGEDKTIKEFIDEAPYCKGCHGEKEKHWSYDCWILECCVNDKDLGNCSECKDFPCDRLIEWAKDDEGYSEALERLRKMKDHSFISD